MPVLDAEEADRALAGLGAESDRMAEALLAMDSHPGHRLLSAGGLTGVSQRRWAEARAAMSVLWEQFSRHREVVEQARQVRGRKAKPGPGELTELTALLTEPVVELNTQRLPIERRGLTGPALVAEHVTLAELVSMMKAGYSAVAEVLAAAEKAWETTVEQLDPLEQELHVLRVQADSLGTAEPALERIAHALTSLRDKVVADPLGAEAAPSGLADELAAVRAKLDELASARDDFESRQYELAALADAVAATESELRSVRATVLEKIDSPGLGPEVQRAPALRTRLAELVELWQLSRWRALADALSEVDAEANAALTRAREDLRFATGLLDRRLELRGRLDAYRAKARGVGHVEDLELADLYQVAHTILYTSPCDLAAATVAVGEYQRVLRERRDGA